MRDSSATDTALSPWESLPAMDWWASTEHKTRYKKDIFESEAIKYELSDCARIAEELDQRMEQLYTITRQSKKM